MLRSTKGTTEEVPGMFPEEEGHLCQRWRTRRNFREVIKNGWGQTDGQVSKGRYAERTQCKRDPQG